MIPLIASTPSGCWIWTGSRFLSGYPRWKKRDDYRDKAAHRVIYEMFNGPIAFGMQLDHLCRVKLCVNPVHLEPVEQRENLRRQHAGRRR